MLDETDNLLRDIGAELVFGLVAPVGADLERLEADLVDLLGLYGYATNPIRLSALLRKVPGLGIQLKEEPEVDRINSYMDAGNVLRERSNSESILAAWALLQIKKMRDAAQPVLRRTAHILRSIKHPAEARALRAVYGPGFYLIALSASTAQKVKYLKQRGLTEPEAHQVIDRDAGEENDFGQHTRDAFETSSRSDRDEDCFRGAKKVVFEPFMGIGPRRFFDLFSMKLSNGYPLKRKQKPDGVKVKWKISDEAIVRVPMPRTTYLEREARVAQLVTAQLKEKP